MSGWREVERVLVEELERNDVDTTQQGGDFFFVVIPIRCDLPEACGAEAVGGKIKCDGCGVSFVPRPEVVSITEIAKRVFSETRGM